MRVPKIDPIDYLVTRRFPESYTPAPREAQPVSARRQFLEGIKPPSQEVLDAAREYRKELESLPGEEVKKLYDREVVINSIENDKTKFFNKPEAQADFEYWSKMSHWKLDEAIALSFGKDPKIVYKKRVEKIPYYISPFGEEYMKRSELAQRALIWKALYDPVMPQIFVNWARKIDIPFPEELAKRVARYHPNLVDWQSAYKDLKEKYDRMEAASKDGAKTKTPQEQGSLKTRERETLLKMVISMAMDGYGYDPYANKSPTAKELEGILDEACLPVSDDTIRKWLREAAELLPSRPAE